MISIVDISGNAVHSSTRTLRIGDAEFDVYATDKKYSADKDCEYIVYNDLIITLHKEGEQLHEEATRRKDVTLEITADGDLKIAVPFQNEAKANMFYEANRGKRNLHEVITFRRIEDLPWHEAKVIKPRKTFDPKTHKEIKTDNTIKFERYIFPAHGGMTVFTEKAHDSEDWEISTVASYSDIASGKSYIQRSTSADPEYLSWHHFSLNGKNHRNCYKWDWHQEVEILKHGKNGSYDQSIIGANAILEGGLNAKGDRNIIQFPGPDNPPLRRA